MARDLLVRGLDDQIRSQLGETAERLGVTLNSIVNDALSKWLEERKKIPMKHYLIIYDDKKSLRDLITTIEQISTPDKWFNSYFCPPGHFVDSILNKRSWFNGTVTPYKPTPQNIFKYASEITKKLVRASKNKPICCLEFILADIARRVSVKKALELEKAYNENRIKGYMFCIFHRKDFLSIMPHEQLDLFYEHDRTCIYKDNRLYRLNLAKENIHELFFP